MFNQNIYVGGKYFSMLSEKSEIKPFEDKNKRFMSYTANSSNSYNQTRLPTNISIFSRKQEPYEP